MESAAWATSLYNLVCYGSDDAGIFHSQIGASTFPRDRVLKVWEYTDDDLVSRYGDNLQGLAKLPALVVAGDSWAKPNTRSLEPSHEHSHRRVERPF